MIKKVTLILSLVFVCMLSNNINAQTRISTLHNIPNGNFLWSKQFLLKFNSNYFNCYKMNNDSVSSFNLRSVGEAYVGITEYLLVGMQAGWQPSLSFKAKVLSEKGDVLPTISLEARNIFSSPEASLYRVYDKDTLKGLQNSAAVILSKSLPSLNMRVHLGVESFPMWKKEKYSFFLGTEYFLGSGFYISTETFKRFKDTHTNITTSWRFEKNFIITFGVSEAKKYFLNDNGEFGLNFGGHKPGNTGYDTPGFLLTIGFSGNIGKGTATFSIEDEIRIQNERIFNLETKIKQLGDTLKNINIESQGIVLNETNENTDVVSKLEKISNMLASDTHYEPKTTNKVINKIIDMGSMAIPTLCKIAIDKTRESNIRTGAISIIGKIGNPNDKLIRTTLKDLLKDKTVEIRLEALIAILSRKETKILPNVEKLVYDPEEVISTTAKEVVEKLTPKNKTAEK